MSRKKYTYEDVKKHIESDSFCRRLISKTYINNKTKLDIECVCGNFYKKTYGRFIKGQRCPMCSRKKNAIKRAHTIEYVRKYYENEGYLYLSEKYTNTLTKELVQCPEGHQYEVRFNDFQQGVRCPVCSGNKKLTIGYVRKYIEGFGYVLLSTEYVNNSTKLLVQCPEGHQYSVSFHDFKSGNRCPLCSKNKKPTIEYVRKYIEGFGYVLLSKVYVNAHTKLLVQCPEGHQYKVKFNNFKSGYRCPICAGNKKLTIEYVRKYYENEGYKYLSTTYTNALTKELVQCPEGHQWCVSFNTFKTGNRCFVCYSINRKHTIEDVRKYYENEGYLYLSTTYTNALTKELIQCPEGHQYEVRFGHFKNGGNRCPICWANSTSSKAEIEIQELVKTLTKTTVLCNDRTKIVNTNTGHYLELDIYLPDLNKAIEYNGIFWHSSDEVKIRDKMKVDQCKNLGIDLLVINEHDYVGNEEKVKEEIRKWLKK